MPTKKEKQPLSVTHPELAKEADGWDPSAVTMGSNKKINWKCSKGHIWATSPNARTNNHLGCPVCSGYKVLAGYNDLATTFPEVAAEADGWDPTEFIAGSRKKMPWICPKDHKYVSSITHRTRSQSGCSICSNTTVLPGYNDLATFFPDIGKQAEGWDPTTVTAGSNKKRKWKCEDGHIWESTPNMRTGQNQGCSVCANMQLLKGYNDLATTFPEVAAEADGWDPTKVIGGSAAKKKWRCSVGHKYVATLHSRTTNQTGCPSCSVTGFDPNKDGWLYFMEHESFGYLQIGITNFPDDRLKLHSKFGWTLLQLRGPMDGHLTANWETSILRMLRARNAQMGPGKADINKTSKADSKAFVGTEMWLKASFQANSINELMRLTEEFEGN